MRNLPFALLLLATISAGPPSSRAEHYEVKMLNRSEAGGLVYEPDFLRIQPGDTVKFLATDSSHNAASIPEMLPQNGRPFKGQINQEIKVTFDVVGSYGIRCIPHYGMGMVVTLHPTLNLCLSIYRQRHDSASKPFCSGTKRCNGIRRSARSADVFIVAITSSLRQGRLSLRS